MGCCGSSRSKFNVEFYKWSSAEFPEEYALIYRYYGQAEAADAEPESCSIFHWRVNPDMVICRLADYIWTNPQIPARIHMKVTTEKDSNGVYNFRKVRVAADGTHKHDDDDDDVEVPPQPRVMVYLSYNNDGCSYVVQRRDQSIARGNLNKTIWEVKHSYHITLRKSLRFHMSIQCDRETGLRVEFSGPLKCKGLFSGEVVGSKIDREVKGEPPRAFIREVETEFKGEEFTLFKPPSRKANSGARPNSVSSSVTGLVNNIGAQIQGLGNASIYNNCQFHAPPTVESIDTT